MAASTSVTINLRILVDGKSTPSWRLRVLGFVARALRVPLDVRKSGPLVDFHNDATTQRAIAELVNAAKRRGLV